MQTIYTNADLQLYSIYRRRILSAAKAFPSRYYFSTHVFVPKSDLDSKCIEAAGFDDVSDSGALREVAILRHSYRTDENRLGIVSLIPKKSPALLTGNPVCPKGANLTLATILH